MPVHSESVITTRLVGFKDALYDTLTAKEYFCYEESERELTPPSDDRQDYIAAYQPFFQSLSDAVELWLDEDWGSLTGTLEDLEDGLYNLVNFNQMFGTGQSLFDDGLKASDLFSLGTYEAMVISQPDDYYDDIIWNQDEMIYEAPTITADTAYVENDAFADDSSTVSSKQSSVQSANQAKVRELKYEEDIETINPPYSKSEKYDQIYSVMEYKQYFNKLGITGIDPKA